jgi:hypothetical protein
MLGRRFAHGSTREVYDAIGKPDVVIKKTIARTPVTNWREYLVWEAARLGRWRNVLGEITAISESGSYLMMERLVDLTDADKAKPPDIPYWLNDLKPKNFGKTASGLIKARDYGVVNLGFDLHEAIPWQVPWKR